MNIIFIVVILLFCLTVHEVSHGIVAFLLGDNTASDEGRLTLNPLVHIEPFMSLILPAICIISGLPIIGGAKPIPVDSSKINGGKWGMALVSLAGPMSNFIMAFVAFGVFSTFKLTSGVISSILVYFIKINIGLGLFNLLPIPPLDGSKVIFPIAPEFIQDFFRKMESSLFLFFVIILIFSAQISNLINLGVEQILYFFQWIF